MSSRPGRWLLPALLGIAGALAPAVLSLCAPPVLGATRGGGHQVFELLGLSGALRARPAFNQTRRPIPHDGVIGLAGFGDRLQPDSLIGFPWIR